MYKVEVKIAGCNNIRNLRHFMKSNNISVVLFGEYHGFTKQIQVQRAIIKNVKPDFFLYELLEEEEILNKRDAKKFFDKPNKMNFSVISDFGNLKPMIKLARSFDLPIIGCDLRNMGYEKDWREKNYSSEQWKKMNDKREIRQAKIINEYISKGLVFAILGDYHIRKDSLVLSKLKCKKVIIVRPSFRWEERFNHPNEFRDSEVSYVIQLKSKSP